MGSWDYKRKTNLERDTRRLKQLKNLDSKLLGGMKERNTKVQTKVKMRSYEE